jgi:hypothetical protein
MYLSLQASDPSFFTKVLFAIDNTLQFYWRSSSTTEDRLSMNDWILFMSYIQDSILQHNFLQQIPKMLTDRMNSSQEGLCNGKFHGGGRFQGKKGNCYDLNRGKPEIITENDKNHTNWYVKQGEDFAKVFYKNQ